MIKVRATRLGYYGLRRVQPGTEFEVDNEKAVGSWMQVLDAPKPRAAKVGPKKDDEDDKKPVMGGGAG